MCKSDKERLAMAREREIKKKRRGEERKKKKMVVAWGEGMEWSLGVLG